MNLPRIKMKGTKGSFKKILLKLGERAFLIFLGLFIIVLILGAVIYYQYNILAKKKEVQAIKEPLQFQEKTYQSVFRIWQEREKKIEEAGLKEYSNPFEINHLKETTSEEPSGSSEIDQE